MGKKSKDDKSYSVSEDIAKRFGAAQECFLGEFKDAVLVGDRLGAALALTRLAQLGMSQFEVFSSGAEALISGDKEKAKCHEAAKVVAGMVEKNLERWYKRSNGAN